MNETEKRLYEAEGLLMITQMTLKQCIDSKEFPMCSSAWLPAKMIDEFLGDKSVYTNPEWEKGKEVK